MVDKRALGSWGEDQAALFLRRQGYAILDRNFHCRYGELDIVASRDRFVAFVEVKLRKNDAYGAAKEFVDARKQQKVRLSAICWLQAHKTQLQPRFDVIEVYAPYGQQTRAPTVNHIPDAFM